ncbi:hypothetical protein S245_035551 [Arachis hypogaea]
MKFKDQERFISLAKELAKVGTGFSLGDLFPSAKWLQLLSGLRPKIEKLHGQTDQILQNIINEHKEAKSSKSKEGQGEVEGLLDVLLRFEDGNGSNQDFSLTSNNIKAIILVSIVIFHAAMLDSIWLSLLLIHLDNNTSLDNTLGN